MNDVDSTDVDEQAKRDTLTHAWLAGAPGRIRTCDRLLRLEGIRRLAGTVPDVGSDAGLDPQRSARAGVVAT